jgi:hypothetical protein
MTMPDSEPTLAARVVFERINRADQGQSRGFGALRFTNPEQVADYERQRGRSAIFICPYTDCLHVADADMQASFNIALRGFAHHAVRRARPELFKSDSDAKRRERQAAIDAVLEAWSDATAGAA